MKFLKNLAISIIFGMLALSPSMASALDVGVNYKSLVNFPVTDTAYLATVGYNASNFPIRIDFEVATSSGAYAFWKPLTQQIHSLGFYTMWGAVVESGSANTSTLTAIHDAQIADVIDVCTHNYADEWQIGNEDEGKVFGGYTGPQYRAFVRSMATDAKAAILANCPSSQLKISYAVGGWCNDLNKGIDGWVADGTMGDLDYLTMNTYGNITAGGNGITWCGKSDLEAAVAKFPGRINISEFNNEADNANWKLMPPALQTAQFGQMLAEFKKLNIRRAYIYSWRGYLDGNDDFAMQHKDGTRERSWDNNMTPNKITITHNFGG